MITNLSPGITVIVGSCATGKTWLANRLCKTVVPSARVYHTDDYLQYGTDHALFVLSKEIHRERNPYIILEGNLACKFLRLRQLANRRYIIPAILECTAPKEVRLERIVERGKDPNATFNMDAIIYKQMIEYKRAAKLLPEWVVVNTLTL